jgi:ABC-type nitrate/sulfonate/bicarbonate transport system ATPase subunit
MVTNISATTCLNSDDVRSDLEADTPAAMAAARPLVEFRDLDVTYPGGIVAVKNFNLSVSAGEFVVILGPSGCGKSTVLQVVAGLLPPTSGRVEVAGKINPPPGKDRGFVFQHAGLLPWFDIFTNIEIGLRAKGMSRKAARAVSQRYVGAMGLEGFGHLYPHQLSGGMQQRVGVARAFAIDPPILLMDEPFAALDAQTRLLLQEELIRLWEGSGKTIIFVTHSIEEAVFLADRVVVMARAPGSVKASVDIMLPRPRSEKTRSHPHYLNLFNTLWGMIRLDAQRAISETDLSENA